MRTHAEIITAAGAQALSDRLHLSLHTVRSWAHRGSIPAKYWPQFTDGGFATLDELVAKHAEARAA